MSMISIELKLLRHKQLSLSFKAPIVKVGTLYKITAACYALGLNILSAKIDTVFDTDKNQLMSNDLFILQWTGDTELHIGQAYQKIAQLIDNLILKEVDIQQILQDLHASSRDDLQTLSVKAQWIFDQVEAQNSTQLYVESEHDSPGFLYKICHLFYDLNVSIDKATVKTNAKGKVEDHFYLSENGLPLSSEKIKMLEQFFNHK